jgi:hypothetical protein
VTHVPPLQLTWRPHVLCSCLHAAEALTHGRTFVDPRLAQAVAPATEELAAALAAIPVPAPRAWRRLLSLSPLVESPRELAWQTLVKLVGSDRASQELAQRIGGVIAHLQSEVRRAFPQLLVELALRGKPLREQWEARGPGLLRAVGLATEESLIVQAAHVILVQPALGGGGEAHLNANTVRIEAVLANPHAELPEVVRLAWLLAQLQLDLPAISDRIHADRLPHVARYAMLVPVLQAAEQVELVHCSPLLIERAISAWQITVPPDVNPVELVLKWWETYRELRPTFPVAMTALDQMFG